jgi:hypothetical protein
MSSHGPPEDSHEVCSNVAARIYFVSAFVVPEKRHVDEVEALLITTMTTANRATPKIKRITFPGKAWKEIRKVNRLPA